MGFVRSFQGYAPPERFDGKHFASVEVGESASRTGPFTTIDTITLDPLDADPSEPQERSFTVSNATLDPHAWYRLVWVDQDANRVVGDTVWYDNSPEIVSVEDVARIMRVSDVSPEDRERIQRAIRDAVEWAKLYLKWPTLGEGGSVTESFYGTRTATVLGTVTQVAVALGPSTSSEVLPTDAYYVSGNRLRIVRDDLAWPGLPLEEQVAAKRTPWRVDVTYDSAELNPMLVTGIAHAAAALWYRGPRLAKGLVGESIGDYSYQVAQLLSGDPFFEQATRLLKPFVRRTGLVVP